ncbi:MAG: single-stranded-DNA-specific exonuclease RecJ [Deinococcaceae bacterium]
MTYARWLLNPPSSVRKIEGLRQALNISPALASVWAGRGLDVLHLSHELVPTPNPALKEAAERIVRCIKAKKRIRIHGDYDADGVTATAILVLGLKTLGANVHGFLPHRLNEGYGIHPSRISEHAQSCDLMITVDCGISNLDEIEALTQLGTEVILTDHHSPNRTLPKCLVVHPRLTPQFDPDIHNLTGAGVAYHLLWAIHRELQLPEPREYADLAAIGTIADVAPLLGENRALVRAGLTQMQQTVHTGLKTLLEKCNLSAPTARDVAFLIAPRINATGRLGEVDVAFEFLTTQGLRRGQELLAYIDILNQERKKIQKEMLAEALEEVDPTEPALVLTRDNWHAGIMGIVASKLLDTFYKPVYIVAQGKGSVRSTPGISAVDSLHHSSDLLKRFGGHSGAAGFAIEEGNMGALRDRIHSFVRQFPEPVREIHLDVCLPKEMLTPEFLAEVDALEPYGMGFRPPLWWMSGTLEMGKQMGKNDQHYQFQLMGIRGKQWNTQGFPAGTSVHVAARLEANTYREKTRVELTADAISDCASVEVRGVEVLVRAAPPGACPPKEVGPPPGPDRTTLFLEKMSPRDVLQFLQNTDEPWEVYAEGAGKAFLERQYPNIRLTKPGKCPTHLVLMSLPTEECLAQWQGVSNWIVSWGNKTLEQMATQPQRDSESFWQFEWFHRHQYLSASEFGRAFGHLLHAIQRDYSFSPA